MDPEDSGPGGAETVSDPVVPGDTGDTGDAATAGFPRPSGD